MITIHHAVEVPYPQHLMYTLVNDVTSYPEFIPFCTSGELTPLKQNTVQGTLTFAWLGIVESFVTHNVLHPPHTIQMTLVEGPFKHLEGAWQFKELPDGHTQVEFSLKFEFELSNSWFDYMLQPIFNTLSQNVIHVFVKRAHDCYGKSENRLPYDLPGHLKVVL